MGDNHVHVLFLFLAKNRINANLAFEVLLGLYNPMIISVTRMRLKRLRLLFSFFSLVSSIKRQMLKAPGLLKFRLSGFTTVTLWENKAAMDNFRNTDAHLEAMKQARHIVRWVISENYEGNSLPSQKEADQRMKSIQKNRDLDASFWTPF